jgi:hypothetical protein
MLQGLICRIGSGTNTHAWNKGWIPRGYMLRPLGCKKENPPTQVSAFISGDSRSWKMLILEGWFLPMDVEQICKIPLSARRHEDDWAWHYERSGALSVRSVYRLLVHTKRRREDWIEHRSGARIRQSKKSYGRKCGRFRYHQSSASSYGA